MKKPSAPKPRVTLSFKVAPELKEALERAAAQDDRTLSGLVQQLLLKAMRERKLLMMPIDFGSVAGDLPV